MKEEIKQEEVQPISKVILIFILIISILSLINSLDIIRKGSAFFKIGEPLIYEIIYINEWLSYIVDKLNSFYCLIILFALYGVSIKKKSSFFILICIAIQMKTQVIENILHSLKYATGLDREVLIIFIINIVSEAIMYLLIYKIFKSYPFLLYKIAGIFSIFYLAFSIKELIEQNNYTLYMSYKVGKDELGLLSLLFNYNFSLILIIFGTIMELFKQRIKLEKKINY